LLCLLLLHARILHGAGTVDDDDDDGGDDDDDGDDDH